MGYDKQKAKKDKLQEAQAMIEEDIYHLRFETRYMRKKRKALPKVWRNERIIALLSHYRKELKRYDEIFPLLQIFDRTNVDEMIKRVDVALKYANKERL